MTPEEARQILGVEANAAPEAVRRAYLKLVKRHKPDRDPEGFRRVRDAYELVRALSDCEVVLTVLERGSADDVPERPVSSADADSCAEGIAITEPETSTLSPEAVEAAIEADDHEQALELVMDDAWAAQVDSPWFAHATYRLGQLLVLAQPHAFAAIEARYADVFESAGDQLLHARAVSEQWYRFKEVHGVPEPLRRFIERVVVADEDEANVLARKLTLWFWSDVDAALAVLRKLENAGTQVAGYLLGLLEDFEPYVDECGGELSQLGPQPTPRASLRALLVPGMILTVAVVVVAFVRAMASADIDSATALGKFFRSMMMLGSVLGVQYLEAVLFEHIPSLHRRLLLACLGVDQRPVDAAVGFREHLFVRQSIAKNLSLELGWHIGRLARLPPP